MSNGCGVGAADLRPVLPVVEARQVLHAVSAAPRIAAVTAAPELGIVIASLTIGVVRIGEVVVGGTGGPCPHMTALMDSSNQPIRESATGLVILVETH